jgi:hypothetical protein
MKRSSKLRLLNNTRGGAELVMVVFMTSALAVATIVTLNLVGTAMTSTGQFIQNKKALYAAEGGIRMVQKLSQTYLADNPCGSTTAASLQTCSGQLSEYIAAQIKNITMGSYQFSLVQSNIISENQNQEISAGPFVGMDAQLSSVTFGLQATNGSGNSSATVYQTSQIGMIKLFQFFLFLDNYVNWNPGATQNVTGHVHSNATMCLGGSSMLSLTQVTSAGQIYNLANSNCRAATGGSNIQVSTNGNLTNTAALLNGADSGCINCGGTGQAWNDYATARWNGFLQDQSMGVPNLQLPGMDTNVPAQEGYDTGGNKITNNGSLRILVDPLLPTDTGLVATTKLSYQADIRIINGVWYLKDINNPNNWPGIPIWSDHPGSFTTTNEQGIEGSAGLAVGQDDLRIARGWPRTPQNFSYYAYDSVNQKLSGSSGVISYGNLYRDASGTPIVWRPGQWSPGNNKTLCPIPATQRCTNCSTSGTVSNTYGIMDATQTPMICSDGTTPVTLDISTSLLNATRGGFMNGHAQGAVNGSNQMAHQLPMNFDMANFEIALNNPIAGELGSYFQSGGLMGRPFNGIVYITNTWNGSLQGTDGTTTPLNPPAQGSQTDASQPLAITQPNGSQTNQQALPFELCTNATANPPTTTVHAGQQFDGTATGVFKIPTCSSYALGTGTIKARPTQVRIINGSNLSPTANPNTFSNGVSIVTSLPAYVLGDFNTSSVVTSATVTPWVASMIASDFISTLSNAWDDQNSPWGGNYYTRNATNTTYNVAFLVGYMTEAVNGAGGTTAADLNNITRYNEDWTGKSDTINGSIVFGFNSIYFHYINNPGTDTYEPPNRFWSFDPHLANTYSQPPGTPSFYVYSVQNWYQ